MAGKRQCVAVDTNVLLDLANKAEPVIDALATLRRRIKGVKISVTPTVLHELANLVDYGVTAEIRAAALLAGERLHRNWRFEPANLSAVEHGIAERIATRLLNRRLLPEAEVHDALILAEAALRGCSILLTSDTHLREMDYRAAALELKACDVEMPVIATPREIVFKFF
jgi:predicted nucleic acid-binding protein